MWHPAGAGGHLPHQRRRLRHQDQKQPREVRGSRPMLFGEFVLAHAGLAVDEGDSATLGVGMHPPTEAAGHPEHVLLVQGLVRAGQASPPVAKPAPLLAERKIAVEHDPIRAVVAALQQFLVVVREIIIPVHATIVPDRAHGHRRLAPSGRASFPKRSLGESVEAFTVSKPEEFEVTFTEMSKRRIDGLIVMPDVLTVRHRTRIVGLAAKERLPTIYGFADFGRAGGLMAYSANVPELFRRAATYVDKILKGARPAELPVEQPTKFELVINMKTAKALGL